MKTFLFLLTLALLVPSAVSAIIAPVLPRIESQPHFDPGIFVASVSFVGTWKTFNRCRPVEVTLTQVGDKVTGTYSPGNGKISNGNVEGNKLRFKWTQDGGTEGSGEFIMDDSGKGFAGTSSQLKPMGFVYSWSTYSPSMTPFAGTWQARIDGRNDVSLTLRYSGDQVLGQYDGNGRLAGTISGKVLRFRWQSDRGTGSGRFVMEEKDNSFSGTYNRSSNPDDVESTWSGNRLLTSDSRPGPCDPLGTPEGEPINRTPEGSAGRNLSEAELAKKQAEYEERQRNAPVAFDGVWRVKSGEQFVFPELLLQAVGSDKIVGRLFANRPDYGVIKEGIVVRNTLRFTVWRPRPSYGGRVLPDDYMGTGEVVMDPDGKSFKGTIVGASISGIRIAR